MIKPLDYNKEATIASLQRILEEKYIAEIGDAGLLDSNALNSLGLVAMTARSEIPPSHRRVADGYSLMNSVYGAPVVKGRINYEENSLLQKYDFNRLEFSTIRQINEELAFLQQGSISLNRTLRNDCDKILAIRAKELRFLAAARYATISNEIFTGYMAIQKYFEMISSNAKPYKRV